MHRRQHPRRQMPGVRLVGGRACALAKTGKETGRTFVSDARSDTAWSFEYEGGGRLCLIWVGDDGKSEIDPFNT